MGNMSYCRFSNTLDDLDDCYENMHDEDLSSAEASARRKLIKLCVEIAEDYGYEVQTRSGISGEGVL